MPVPYVGTVARPQAWGYDGYIGNILVRLAVSNREQLERVTAPASPPKVDTSSSAEDVRDEVGQRYSRSNLSGGAGIDFLHTPQERVNVATRFWDSKGVDVFGAGPGHPYAVRLQHEVAQDISDTASVVIVGQVDGTVYWLANNAFYQYPNTLRHTFTGATMVNMVVLGNTLYFLDGTNGVTRIDPATSWTPSVVSATIYDQIWAVKGRVVASLNEDLYEVVDGGADVLIGSLETGEQFNDVIDASAGVLAFCSDQTVRSYTLNSSQNLAPAGVTKTVGEVPTMAAFTQGVVGYATRASTAAGGTVVRFYTAELNTDSLTLTNQQLVYELGDRTTTKDLSPATIYEARDSIYLAVPDEDSNEVHLWRYYLPTGGYARDLVFGFGSALTVSSLVEVDDRFYAGVPTSGLWLEQDTYVSDGWVVAPAADFFTAEPKQWVSAKVTSELVPAGCSVLMYDSTEVELLLEPLSGLWNLVTRIFPGQSESEILSLAGRNSRYHLVKIELRSDATNTNTPEWQSFSARGLPNPQRDVLVRLPVNVSDQFEAPGKRPLRRRNRGLELEQVLSTFEGQQTILEIYRVGLQMRGLVERVEAPVETISERGSVTRVMWVTMRGKRILESEGFGSNVVYGTLGIDLLGVELLGVGEEL